MSCVVRGIGGMDWTSSEVSVQVHDNGDVYIFEHLYPSDNLNMVILRGDQVKYVIDVLKRTSSSEIAEQA